jgi:hypothetical protein
MPDRVDRGAEGGACARIVDWREAIVDPRPVTAGVDESGAAEIGKMARDRRLRQPQRIVDVADAYFAGGQQTQDAKPCRVA